MDIQGVSGRYPDAAMMPSVTPDKPSLRKVLAPFIESSSEAFHCPEDLTYFPAEGLSYEYRSSRAREQDSRRVAQRSAVHGSVGGLRLRCVSRCAHDGRIAPLSLPGRPRAKLKI